MDARITAIRAASTGRHLNADEERILGQLTRAGDLDARNLLVERNIGLVRRAAGYRSYHFLTDDDLMQEGTLGLMHAADTFDPDRGTKFSTHATFWIVQAIGRAVDNQERAIRLPVHMTQRLTRIRRAASDLGQALGREPDDGELCAHLGIDQAMLDGARAASTVGAPISLDSPQEAPGGDNYTLGDIIPDPDADGFVDQIAVAEALAARNRAIGRLLVGLPLKSRRVLELRFGLADGEPRTLDGVGRVLGLTRERVRQIEVQALARLRASASPQLATAAD
jgi:RNA polymerase primary sigma factor